MALLPPCDYLGKQFRAAESSRKWNLFEWTTRRANYLAISQPASPLLPLSWGFLLRRSMQEPIHSSSSPPPLSSHLCSWTFLSNFAQKLGNSAALCALLFDLCSNYPPPRINLIFYFQERGTAASRMMEGYWKVLVPRLTLSFAGRFLRTYLHCLFPRLFSRFSLTYTDAFSPSSPPPPSIARPAAFAETTSSVRIADRWSKKFWPAWNGAVGASCVDDIQSNQSIIASISAGGGSYLAVTWRRNNSLVGNTNREVHPRAG